MTRAIEFYVFPGHQILDLAGPLSAFEMACRVTGAAHYTLRVVARTEGLVASSSGAPVGAQAPGPAPDTLIVAGGDIGPMLARGEVDCVRALAGAARRTASVCTGAFLLAEAGLLDGKNATTHWRMAGELQRRYPAVRVAPDRIFVKDGEIWTSAGISAGIDLALALIEADHGAELAQAVAQQLVVYHRRAGGQSQFSVLSELKPESDRIRAALSFAREHLAEPLPVERLAEAARLSVRQFTRAFRRETGETPARAVERLRAEAARQRLQDSGEPVEAIARAVGFADPERMRRAFVKLYGQPPQAIRRASRAADLVS